MTEQSPLVPWHARLASAFPSLVRGRIESIARKPRGTLYWLNHEDNEHIEAYFRSRYLWKTIRGWDEIKIARPTEIPNQLNHGYDEQKTREDNSIKDVQEAAHFRGGACLSKDMVQGDWHSLLC